MKTLYLDTNIFIQCRDLGQLPWKKVFGEAEHLLLYIPRSVQEEIDRHKQDGNSRRAKRARKASSFIRNIILSEDTKLCIKESKPIIEISFTPPLSKECNLPEILDMSRPDDRIIAEIIKYRHNYPDDNVALLTHDTNPLLTAKRCGLSYYVIPDDWLLPPEPDSKDKKIIELENRIKELQNNFPIIETFCVDGSGNEINHLPVEVTQYSSFSESELDELINEVKKRYPMETHFPKEPPKSTFNAIPDLSIMNSALGYTRKFVPPSDDEISNYQNTEHPAWIEKVKEFFTSLPQQLENPTRNASLTISIFNNGNVPAENIIVEFKALGGIFLKPHPEDDEDINQNENIHFPSPPEPPRGRWIKQKSSILDMMDHYRDLTSATAHLRPFHDTILKDFPGPLIPKERDINAFYWKNGKPSMPVKSWSFECKEFRHKIEPESFELTVLIPPSENAIEKGAVECSISARNLPKPLKVHIKLDISYVDGNSLSEAKKYMTKL